MRIGTHDLSGPRTPRPAIAMALALFLLGWAGCAAFDRGVTLVPSRYHALTGPFIVYSNAPMPEDPPAVRCLQALERDVDRELAIHTPAAAPEDDAARVQVYILDNRQDFDHFLKFHYPELPHRRAFFLAKGTERLVYTYSSPRLEEDLRHEATHALLRGAFGDLPLWLDEGIAEYFENDPAAPAALSERLDAIAADIRTHWSPSLERLESLTDINQMSQRDYREAWAWVHLLLNGPEPGRSILMAYVSRTEPSELPSRLKPRLANAGINESSLLRHLDGLRSGAPTLPPPREVRAVRMQDQPPDPARTRSVRGLLGRLGAWFGS